LTDAKGSVRGRRRQQRVHVSGPFACGAVLCSACLLISSVARAQQSDDDRYAGVTGSPRPVGLGYSPDAPPVPPAPGGRAPSFGAPSPPDDWAFRFGGRIYAWEAVGIGQEPSVRTPGQLDTTLHVPALVSGRQPFQAQTGASLFLQYGNPVITATVTYHVRAAGQEYQGYHNPTNGAAFGQAYLTITPPALGNAHLTFRVGGFTQNYAGPGLWGWGIFGPLIAVRGYGESMMLEYDLSPELRLYAEHGVLGAPGVPEEFRRGDYTGWTEPGLSTIVHHGHLGFTLQNNYVFKLHYARADGTNERRYLVTAPDTQPHDGHMDVYAAEARVVAVPYGQLGVSGGFWNFSRAMAVHDGIWWGIDWTKGAQDMLLKHVGVQSRGTGQVAAVSAQYDMSLAQLLWYPRNFDGNRPDVRLALAGVRHWTIATEDPAFENATGFLIGTEVYYQMLRWFGTTLRAYGESRDSATGRYNVYSISPGIAFRSDWQSTDRIELIYTRRFYSDAVDNNPAQPLDRDIIALGAYIDF
jgi:hypothetical protein